MPEESSSLLQWPGAGQALTVLARLLLAAMCGALLGVNRERLHRAAGLRTHMLVAISSAVLVLAAREARYADDAISRIVQGLMAGIGFLGAGTILKVSRRGEVQGLTTAASVWLTAALGVTAALAPLWLTLFGLAVAWGVLVPLARLEPSNAIEQRAESHSS